MQAEDEIDQRRLAGAGHAGEHGDAAGRDGQVGAVEHRSLAVGEPQPLAADLALEMRLELAAGVLLVGGELGDQRLDLLERRLDDHRLLQEGLQPAEALDGALQDDADHDHLLERGVQHGDREVGGDAHAKGEQRVLTVAHGLAVDHLAAQRATQPVQAAVEERDELLLRAHRLERLEIIECVGQQAHQLLGELGLRPAGLLRPPDQEMHGSAGGQRRSRSTARASFQETSRPRSSMTTVWTASATNCAASW